MMEIDMQSPPSTFRPVAFSTKRPRSPGSPTQERQTKRLSLAPVGLEGQCVRCASTAPDGMDGRMASQDDWVRQARELSIASPLSVTVDFPSALDSSATMAPSRVDERMAVDDEESQMFRVHVHLGNSRPWTTTRSHLPSIHISTTPMQAPVQSGLHAPSPAPFSVLTELPSSSTESVSSTSSISLTETSARAHTHHSCPPDIFLFPATPSDIPSQQHPFAADYGQQAEEGELGLHSARLQDQSLSRSSLTRAEDRIDGSPRPSRTPDMPTSSGRKHRVTMGPRADCVKCRTGVRGHWMHFD